VTFEWDPRKSAENRARHGVTFEEAATVFRDRLSATGTDPDHSVDEDRFITFGMSTAGRLLVVAHTNRDDTIRSDTGRSATTRCSAGTSGRRCSMRLEGARTSSTATATTVRFCWNSRPRSIVTSASYSPSMRRRSSPFVMPVHPRLATVSTVWPWSAAARSSGSCSSRRTRTSEQCNAREGEGRDCLVASYGWERCRLGGSWWPSIHAKQPSV
jgi:uncharacterized DUF497 family protein